MRERRIRALAILLAAGFAFSSPLMALAKKGKGGGGESMKGGLPALEDRVDADEAAIAALQGLNNWAVVASDGTLSRSSSSPGPVTVAAHTAGTGTYEVDFNKDVSGCAYVATLGDIGTGTPLPGEVSVAGATSVDGVIVQTFDKTGATADASFHLIVSCP